MPESIHQLFLPTEPFHQLLPQHLAHAYAHVVLTQRICHSSYCCVTGSNDGPKQLSNLIKKFKKMEHVSNAKPVFHAWDAKPVPRSS